MKIPNRFEKPRHLAKLGVGIDLLQMCLGQSFPIVLVVLVGPIPNEGCAFPDLLVPQDWLTVAANLLRDGNPVPPRWCRAVFREGDLDLDVGFLSRRQAADFREPTTLKHRPL